MIRATRRRLARTTGHYYRSQGHSLPLADVDESTRRAMAAGAKRSATPAIKMRTATAWRTKTAHAQRAPWKPAPAVSGTRPRRRPAWARRAGTCVRCSADLPRKRCRCRNTGRAMRPSACMCRARHPFRCRVHPTSRSTGRARKCLASQCTGYHAAKQHVITAGLYACAARTDRTPRVTAGSRR